MEPIKVEILNNSSLVKDSVLIIFGWLLGIISQIIIQQIAKENEAKKAKIKIGIALEYINSQFSVLVRLVDPESFFYDEKISKKDQMDIISTNIDNKFNSLDELLLIYATKYEKIKYLNIQYIIQVFISEFYPEKIIFKKVYDKDERNIIFSIFQDDVNKEIEMLKKSLYRTNLAQRIKDKIIIKKDKYFSEVIELMKKNI